MTPEQAARRRQASLALRLASQLLDMAAEEFGNHGCNDFNLEQAIPDREERVAFIKAFEDYNSKGVDFDPESAYRNFPDFALMGFVAHLLRQKATQTEDNFKGLECLEDLMERMGGDTEEEDNKALPPLDPIFLGSELSEDYDESLQLDAHRIYNALREARNELDNEGLRHGIPEYDAALQHMREVYPLADWSVDAKSSTSEPKGASDTIPFELREGDLSALYDARITISDDRDHVRTPQEMVYINAGNWQARWQKALDLIDRLEEAFHKQRRRGNSD